MTTKTLDFNKPIQTRDGLKVRILCTNLKAGGYTIAAAVTNTGGSETLECFTDEGRYYSSNGDHRFDLMNVPEESVTYMNVYEKTVGFEYETLEEVQSIGRTSDLVATLKLTKLYGKIIKKEIVAG